MTDIYPRFLESRLLEALSDSPIVLLEGPRQCGKTTLARRALESLGYAYIACDTPANKRRAQEDAAGLVAELPERAILDEVQNVPEIFSVLRGEVDRRRVPGRFLLTGSSHVLSLPKLTDSLAGRIEFLRLHPLSQSEIARWRPDFLPALFGEGFRTGRHARLGPTLRDLVVAGGYPPALSRSTVTKRVRWHRSNLSGVIRGDILELLRVDNPGLLRDIMSNASACTSGVQNVNGIASDLQSTMPTVKRYLGVLEQMFLLERLRPWHRSRPRRLVKAPKLHLGDTGLACGLLNTDADALKNDRLLYGNMLETYVYQELRRQSSWQDFEVDFYHFRHKEQAEVDIVLMGSGGSVAGVEVRAGSSVGASDFRGLRLLAEAAGKRFVRGVVLYDGEACTRHGERLQAVPIRRLWEPPE